ncbi:MAG: aminodeoxychorismate synthase component I [Jeotgalicoccus sp.]
MRAHTKFKKNGKVEDLYFTNPVEIITKDTPFNTALNKAEQYQKDGLYAVIGVTYEKDDYIIGIYENSVSYTEFLGGKHPEIYQMSAPELSETREEIENNIEQVRNYILDGHTYQVNYTTRLYGDFAGDSHQLFLKLSAQNNGDYAVYIDYDDKQIVSLSPELFFAMDADRKISTKPMKGTAPRFENQEEDKRSYEFLRNSKKDQAENVMIVDLLRNDISKIAKPDSVTAAELFTIEKYQTVYQMISTVEADVKDDVTLSDTFDALFPCGSITGAPKQMTMRLIEKLEKTPRGFYCGALGILYPDASSVFNVPIRTLTITGDRYIYSAGGGITYDSIPSSEFEEILHKTSFLKQGQYELIETMRLEDGTVKRFSYHENRLNKSAAHFNFIKPDFKEAVASYIEGNNLTSGVYKLRATLSREGKLNISHAVLPEKNQPVTAVLAEAPILGAQDFIVHKTTVRHQYGGKRNDSDVVLYYNDNLDITEFNIGSIVIKEAGKFYTPPLSSGILSGVMRQALIDDEIITEQNITLNDLRHKYKNGQIDLFMINSAREWVAITPGE